MEAEFIPSKDSPLRGETRKYNRPMVTHTLGSIRPGRFKKGIGNKSLGNHRVPNNEPVVIVREPVAQRGQIGRDRDKEEKRPRSRQGCRHGGRASRFG